MVFMTSYFARSITKGSFLNVENDEFVNKVINWHLFKGGVKVQELDGTPQQLIELGF